MNLLGRRKYNIFSLIYRRTWSAFMSSEAKNKSIMGYSKMSKKNWTFSITTPSTMFCVIARAYSTPVYTQKHSKNTKTLYWQETTLWSEPEPLQYDGLQPSIFNLNLICWHGKYVEVGRLYCTVNYTIITYN